MLTQMNEEGIKHPVAYFSKKLTDAQSKYSTIEEETLVLILALSHFDVYLRGATTPICVLTDHNPLSFIIKFKNKNQWLMRWSLILQEWHLEIRHVPR